MSPRELRRVAGRDLWALIRAAGAPLRSGWVLTTLPSPTVAHASLRLTLADGRTVKGRRVERPDQAARMAAIVAGLDPRAFPRILARRGAALLEEWVDGRRLPARPGLDVIERAGALLAAVHRTPPPAGLGVHGPPDPPRRLALLLRQADELERRGALSAALARQARAVAEAAAPRTCATGVIHRDFCAENLVLDRAGRLHVVDNETLQIGAYDFDLARTWYRWPLGPRGRAAFLCGYQRRRSLRSYLAHFPFWAVGVLVDTALYRVRAGTAHPEVPLRRLRALVRDHGDAAPLRRRTGRHA